MPHPNVPFRLRASLRIWPRVAVLGLIGIAVAGCSGSARFDSNPFASDDGPPPPQQNVTGSISSGAPAANRVVSQPLPSPSRPATVASSNGGAYGQGHAAYRPAPQSSEVTGSVARPRSSGHWTWDGGSPVTVGYGETVETIARKYGVPASALMRTNGITSASQIRPGQRLVIPRYVSGGTQRASASKAVAPSRTAENVHVVAPGDTLYGIARRNNLSPAALARANNVQLSARLNVGDRLNIPGGRAVVAQRAPAPPVTQPHTVKAKPEKVASLATEKARIATPETHTTESVTKTAEAAGGIPSFRWPVKGRVIAGFGKRPNGTENDGINLAVPEGTPIKAADDGVVAYAGNELKGYGNLVLIRHANGYVSAYANASALLVKRGDTIKRGQVIARAGQTGNVSSPQLHFEIRKGSTPVDPAKYLS
jgi:murein DD-endopeptidase MepM/ murein hydrolase activator NlpD